MACYSQRGAFSATFGADITKDFCARNGIKSVVRSHQLPKKQRGFEILHDAMLLTIFSASNYGGACRNKGGVLIFDEQVTAAQSAPPIWGIAHVGASPRRGPVRTTSGQPLRLMD